MITNSKQQVIIILSKILFFVFKLFPINRNLIVMECDYGKGFYGNLSYIYEELNNSNHNYNIVIPINKNVFINEQEINNTNTTIIQTRSILHLYYLAVSKIWITNNHYYYFLKPRNDTTFINTWHSLGGIKNIGIFSSDVKEVQKRYKIEGPRIDWFLIGSESTRERCLKSLCLNPDNIVSIGMPRTDPFFNMTKQEIQKNEFYQKYTWAKGKKIILYAPTFRDDQKNSFELKLNLEKLVNNLDSDYIVIIKLHSIIRNKFEVPKEFENFCYDLSTENINTLMFVSEILITDYSSLFFEYSLLKKPIIFFAYDYEEYVTNSREFYHDYYSFVPGPIVNTTEEIIKLINEFNFDFKLIESFSNSHCAFKDGKSSRRFVEKFLL